jgi:predicted nucleotidyltransferase
VILTQLIADAESNPNTLGFLVFGSVAAGTHRPDSDIDVITVLRNNEPTSGIINASIDGIKVGTIFLTYDILVHSVETVPYLLHPIGQAKILFDREGTIEPLLGRIRDYFANHPEIVDAWSSHYQQFRNEKAQFGYEKTTIVDVWNALEKRYSGGKIKRRLFLLFPHDGPSTIG